MISEQEFSFKQNSNEIFKTLYEKGSYDEPNIMVKYFGNKNQIPFDYENNQLDKNQKEENNIELNPEDPRNHLLFLKYENIYIGAVSFNFQRENFGLNIYSNESFYLGRWKENMKEGLGFLKINENIMYMGNFKLNQFNGFGILYNKMQNNFFFGNFNNGEYSEGIFYDMVNDYFYRGKIKDGKKNDNLCTFFDAKNGHLFFGEIIENKYNKGYVFYVSITEEQNEGENEIKFKTQKIAYFDGLGAENKRFFSEEDFNEEFYSKLQDLGNNIFQSDYNIKDEGQNLVKYFNNLNGILNIDRYFDVDSYNSFKDEINIETNFIKYYYHIFDTFKVGQDDLDLRGYQKYLDFPEAAE